MGLFDKFKHRRRLKKFNIDRTGGNIKVHIHYDELAERLDGAQLALDQQISADMLNYMPFKQGNLRAKTSEINHRIAGTGRVYKYDPTIPYAHYIYTGEKYVDPVYRKGGFYSPKYGWWSRPNVAKVPSGEPLKYSQPNVSDHWDDVAYEKHSKEWLELVRRMLR